MLKKIATASILIATGAVAANISVNRRIANLATSEITPFGVGVPSKPYHYLWVEMQADPNYYDHSNNSTDQTL